MDRKWRPRRQEHQPQCEQECSKRGYPIPTEWAVASGTPAYDLCDEHRFEYWEVFIQEGTIWS